MVETRYVHVYYVDMCIMYAESIESIGVKVSPIRRLHFVKNSAFLASFIICGSDQPNFARKCVNSAKIWVHMLELWHKVAFVGKFL